MINSDFGPAFILGIALLLCGVALYAMRSVRPELSRDHDIFFAAIALVAGLILMFQGWRLDPLLFLGQLSLAGSAVFFGVENIRLRKVSTDQAKRNTPVVDDERPVSRNYDYDRDYDYDSDSSELPYANARPTRRIRATRDDRDYDNDDYETSRRRRPASGSRRSLEPRDSAPPIPSSRRPLPRARQRPDERVASRRSRSDWEEDQWGGDRPSRSDQWGEEQTPDSRRPRPSIEPQIVEPAIEPIEPMVASSDADTATPPAGSTYRTGGREPKSLSRYRSRRRSSDRYSNPSVAASGGGDYTDYQPVDYGDDSSSGDDYSDRYR